MDVCTFKFRVVRDVRARWEYPSAEQKTGPAIVVFRFRGVGQIGRRTDARRTPMFFHRAKTTDIHSRVMSIYLFHIAARSHVLFIFTQ